MLSLANHAALPVAVLTLFATAHGAVAQVADEIRKVYEHRTYAADQDSASVAELVAAAIAARYMREFDEADLYLRIAGFGAQNAADQNQILREQLWLELARGGGVEGAKRVFSEFFGDEELPPTVLAGWVNGFPELLVGGEYDSVVSRLSGDAEEADYRCDCYAPKAWMYRAAGDLERSRAYWDSAAAEPAPDRRFVNPFDEADWGAQRARNLARAGRETEARVALERAMAVDVSAFDSVFILRRRAQTWAELGDVDRAVEDLEFLLTVPSPVTLHTLESRLAWAPIRDDPRFQAMLDRHRDP